MNNHFKKKIWLKKNKSRIEIETYWWNKELFHWRNKQIELMRKKHRMFCATLNYIEHLLILASAVTGCVSISAFASSVVIPLGIRCSSVGLKFFAITSN